MEKLKLVATTLLHHLFVIMIVFSLLANVVLYLRCESYIGTIIHLQGEIQSAQDVTLKVLDKVTDKHGYRKID